MSNKFEALKVNQISSKTDVPRVLGLAEGGKGVRFMASCGELFTETFTQLLSTRGIKSFFLCNDPNWQINSQVDFNVSAYKKELEKGKITHGFAMQVGAELIRRADRKNVLNTEAIRGVGVWADKKRNSKRLIINFGNKIGVWDYEKKTITYMDYLSCLDIGSKFVFVEDNKQISPDITNPLLDADMRSLLDTLNNKWEWKHPMHPKFLLGFIFLVPIINVIPIRPHVWVTGATGTGKSFLIDKVITTMLQGMCAHRIVIEQEARYIIQGLRNKAMLVIRDDHEDTWDSAGFANLMYTTWNQKSNLHFMCLYAGTHITYTDTQHTLRTCEVPLVRHGNFHDWKDFDDNYISRFQGRSIRQCQTVIHVFKKIKSRIEDEGVSGNTSDLYSMLLAGFLCATQVKPDLNNIEDLLSSTIHTARQSQTKHP